MNPARFAPLLLAPLLLATGCHDRNRTAVAAMPAQAVTVALVQSRPVAGGLIAAGRLVPREEMAVGSDLSGYRVARVLVEEGAGVRAGQPLAELDGSLLASQVSQLQAALAQQTVAAEQAREQAGRVSGLDDQGVLSNEAIANRRFAARNAAAAQAATHAQLNDLLVRRAHLVIRAPYAGIVTQRTVRPGDNASPGTAMFTMARDGMIELYAEMPEADVARIAVGDPAQVTLASGRMLDGRVRLIGQRVDATSGLVTVRLALPRDRELRAGGFARAQFSRAITVNAVPETAVHYDADGASVMVVGKDDRVRRARVATGAHGQGLVELRAGPPPGSRVAVKGAAFTLDGDKVRVVAEQAK
ncbi:MAG: efflux RND transporter periplasmic adaptor subunit [Sphingomonadales bacterium]|nr:efflux RND transporter periplasmic adaptor subunit [Sphingomonadales bacterium]